MKNRNVVCKGKTVKEAIENGLDLLGTSRTNVDIEIIDKEKRGIFGIGFKPAIVRLVERQFQEEKQQELINETDLFNSIFPSTEKPLSPYQYTEAPNLREIKDYRDEIKNNSLQARDLEGKVWVKDGQLQCKDSPSRYPTITPGSGVVLYKNGERVERTTIVMEHDYLKVELSDESKETVWEIKIDKTKLKAILKMRPGYRKEKVLMDHKPDLHLEINLKESIIPQQTLTLTPVLEKLLELGVVHGINYNEITRACESTEIGEYEVATGAKSLSGENGRLEYMIDLDLDNETVEPKERSDGSIDYRDIRHIPSVEKGQVIAIIHPPIPGKTGITVTGETLIPTQVHDLKIRQGKGITLTKEDTQIVATESGRPKIEQRGILVKVSIMQKLFHQQDVDLASGNIHFIGDVEVTGNVNETMKIEAEGDVLIKGNVNMATIIAGDSIVINRNVIGSEITAGKSNMLIADMSQLLGEIAEHMKKIVIAIEQLCNSPAFKISDLSKAGLSSLIKILLDQKFRSFSALIKQFVETINQGKNTLDEEWVELGDQLHKSFLIHHPDGLRGMEDLIQLDQKIDYFYQYSLTEPEPNSSITVSYLLNSQVYSSGDITIIGQGSYTSKIHTQGALEVKGFLRGGEYFAGLGAVVKEVGSKKGGVPTKIVVPSNQSIKIEMVMEDSIIQVGNRKHQFKEDTHQVFARLDDEGQLLL